MSLINFQILKNKKKPHDFIWSFKKNEKQQNVKPNSGQILHRLLK